MLQFQGRSDTQLSLLNLSSDLGAGKAEVAGGGSSFAEEMHLI